MGLLRRVNFGHLTCVVLPLGLAALGVVAGVALGQESVVPPAAVPVPTSLSDLPVWVVTSLVTGAFGLLLKSGGIPVQVTHRLDEQSRELVRDLRDALSNR